jgi:hypothetical protein
MQVSRCPFLVRIPLLQDLATLYWKWDGQVQHGGVDWEYAMTEALCGEVFSDWTQSTLLSSTRGGLPQTARENP